MARRLRTTIAAGAAAAIALVGFAPAASAHELQWSGWDLTGDGWWETYFTDMNGDGWFDVAKLDVTLDGYEDGAAFDSNHNGRFDLFSLDGNQNGYAELVGRDADEDGQLDLVAIDLNENGVADPNEGSPYPMYAVVGAPTYGGVSGLLLTMADMNGRATFGTGDYDGDGWSDSQDSAPYDRRRA